MSVSQTSDPKVAETCCGWYRAVAAGGKPVVAVFGFRCERPGNPVFGHWRCFVRGYRNTAAARSAYRYWKRRKNVSLFACLRSPDEADGDFAQILWQSCGD